MAIAHVLECERPLHELERKVEALSALAENDQDRAALEAAKHEYREALRDLYDHLQPWDVVRVAATRAGRRDATTSISSAKTSANSTATAVSATTPRSSPALRASAPTR